MTCKKTLKDLQTEYLDMYLIHWPGKNKLKPDDPVHANYRKETWRAFQDLKKQGVRYVQFMPIFKFTIYFC